MEHYVTLFDVNFLPQGLALHESLKKHAGEFTLWVLCMDQACESHLKALGEISIKAVRLEDVESEALLRIKPGRTRAEYCWTLTPFTPDIVFARDVDAARVTYVDADTYFLGSPERIFSEFEHSGKSVLITEHAFDPKYDQTESSGRFCVQFVTFKRELSTEVLRWWQERCVEWCFARHEDGKFGDQKYLDIWPSLFDSQVHVFSGNGLFMAPWNAQFYPADKALFWHFHGLRILGDRRVLLHTSYDVPDEVDERIYVPYVREIYRQMNRSGVFPTQAVPRSMPSRVVRALAKRLLGRTKKVFADKILSFRSEQY